MRGADSPMKGRRHLQWALCFLLKGELFAGGVADVSNERQSLVAANIQQCDRTGNGALIPGGFLGSQRLVGREGNASEFISARGQALVGVTLIKYL